MNFCKTGSLMLFAFLWTCAIATAAEKADPLDSIEIAYSKFVLENGLTLIVHEDPKAPIVAVNVWYHVGSKNEKFGKTGFAHLFEHLMFNGSEHYNDDYFGPFDRVGATDMNGTTNADRTNYFQNVPTPALDMALWMESDRMGHLLGAIDQAKLDEQRGVVQNEKRQGENQPYGKVFNLIVEAAYPNGHPYSWSTIGSMEDLDAASLEDVQEWFKTYYGAANAVITVAGDVKADEVKAKVEAHFGSIASGPPVARQGTWIAKRSGTHRQMIQDRVPQARIIKVWNVPELGSDDGNYMDLASSVLASGKTSRLYKRLVYEDQIASDATAFVWLREIGGLFVVWATALPGQDLAEVEAAIDEEVKRFIAEGPSQKELARVQMEHHSGFVRGIERIGGFGGKSDILASSEIYAGSPDAYRKNLEVVRNATRKNVKKASKRWLSDGAYVLEVQPFPEYATGETDVDRSALPSGGDPPEVSFPAFERATLSSGVEILVAERHAVPVVHVNLALDAGFAADQFASPGTASLAVDMMDEGTHSRDALEISEELALLGANLATSSSLDMSYVGVSALKENLDASLEIYADVVLDPAFAAEDFTRLQQNQLAAIQREKVTPRSMALRVFPMLLYGEGHAYGLPLTGSGNEESVAALTPEDLRTFHATWFTPENAKIIVVGDTTLAEIQPKLEALFGDWKAPEGSELPKKNLAQVERKKEASVYLIDRPGSLQTIIFAGNIAPAKANPNEPAIEAMNEVLGGSFSSRINMNLREDKHWAYGAYSFLSSARGQRPFIAYAPVQTDKTTESMAEIHKELSEITSTRPPSADELQRAQDKKILSLPGRWETGAQIVKSIGEIVRFGFEDDYWTEYPKRLQGLELSQVEAAANEVIAPDQLVWVVVGDRSKIEAGIRELGFGELRLLDADGNILSDGGSDLNADAAPAEKESTPSS